MAMTRRISSATIQSAGANASPATMPESARPQIKDALFVTRLVTVNYPSAGDHGDAGLRSS